MFRRDFFRGLFGGAAVLELPEVKKAEILRLEPNDTIVVSLDRYATAENCERLRALMKQKFPNHNVLVKDGGIDISIIKG